MSTQVFGARAVDQLVRLLDYESYTGWLFPAAKRTKSDRGLAEAGLFNDYFSIMPGVNFSPHGVRYAFATYGERDLDSGRERRRSFWTISKASNPTT
jgi:hypothetical protein